MEIPLATKLTFHRMRNFCDENFFFLILIPQAYTHAAHKIKIEAMQWNECEFKIWNFKYAFYYLMLLLSLLYFCCCAKDGPGNFFRFETKIQSFNKQSWAWRHWMKDYSLYCFIPMFHFHVIAQNVSDCYY